MMKVKIHRMKIDVPSESSRFPFVIPIIKYPIKLHPATVRDTGIGISKENQKKIFEAYIGYRADHLTIQNGSGGCK